MKALWRWSIPGRFLEEEGIGTKGVSLLWVDVHSRWLHQASYAAAASRGFLFLSLPSVTGRDRPKEREVCRVDRRWTEASLLVAAELPLAEAGYRQHAWTGTLSCAAGCAGRVWVEGGDGSCLPRKGGCLCSCLRPNPSQLGH